MLAKSLAQLSSARFMLRPDKLEHLKYLLYKQNPEEGYVLGKLLFIFEEVYSDPASNQLLSKVKDALILTTNLKSYLLLFRYFVGQYYYLISNSEVTTNNPDASTAKQAPGSVEASQLGRTTSASGSYYNVLTKAQLSPTSQPQEPAAPDNPQMQLSRNQDNERYERWYKVLNYKKDELDEILQVHKAQHNQFMQKNQRGSDKPLVVNDMLRRKLQAQTKFPFEQDQSRYQNYFKAQLRKDYQLNKIRQRELEYVEYARYQREQYCAEPNCIKSNFTQQDLNQYYEYFRASEAYVYYYVPRQPSEEEQKYNLVQNFNPYTRECLLGLHLLDPQMVDRKPKVDFF